MTDLLASLKKYLFLALAAASAVLFVLFKREQNQNAELKTKEVADETKGKIDEIQKQEPKAEAEASDARADYERIAAQYRDGGNGPKE